MKLIKWVCKGCGKTNPCTINLVPGESFIKHCPRGLAAVKWEKVEEKK